MAHLKVVFALLAMAALAIAKPSHPFGLHHFDLAPPILPAPHFHAAPAPLLPAPAPHFHAAPAPLLPAPAPLFPAPAPLLPAPVVHTQVVHTPVPVPAPVPVPVPFPVAPLPVVAPSYRAVFGPKTTTHHVSLGYAWPAPAVAAKIVAPHAHLHAAPHAHLHAAKLLDHHHHHTLF